jgi:Family of unknown function (DUF6714)
MSEADKVVSEIRAAFPARRPAPFEPMVNSVSDDEPALTAAAFADKQDWTALDEKWLDEAADGWASALSFLSDEAACFYIPAYLVADVNGALERVDPVFHLTHGFDASSSGKRIWPDVTSTWTEYATNRWSRLTEAQASAVVHYLEWRLSRADSFDSPIIDEALRSFWYRRASIS